MPSARGRKVALVTGSGRGIGRATAILLARRGLDVAVHDIELALAEETVGLIRSEGGQAASYAADVSDVAAMRRIVAGVEADLGGVDVLVNNAGIGSDRCPIESVTEQMFDRSIGVHVRGTLFVTQAVVAGMKQRRYGRIVNISSVQALVGWTEGATYNAAKGAIIAMSKGWAKELAPWTISVNVVAPGHTETEMVVKKDPPEVRAERAKTIPLGRYGQPEDMAHAIGFLASDEASFITGQVLSPNGGFVIT